MEDTHRDKGLRKRLVDSIRSKGITDKKVLAALNKVPRHFFMDSSFISFAYSDKAFPIASGQTISQPYTVAFQSELLQVKEGDKILEIGTGSGYQCAILLEMGARTYSIERHKELFLNAGELLRKMKYHPHLFWGDGYLGKPAYAPYDKILITAGAPFIPDALKVQIKTGGVIVAPIGESKTQIMTRLTKLEDGNFKIEEFGHFSFVPFIKGQQ